MQKLLIGLLCWLCVTGAYADAPLQSQGVIAAENVQQLHSVVQLDFEEVAAQDLSPASGIFVMNADASRIITFANAEDQSPLSSAVIWDGITGDLLQTIFVGENQYDRVMSPDGQYLAVARQDGAALIDLESGESSQILSSDQPILSVWFSSDEVVCGETAPDLDGQAFVLCSDERETVSLFGGVPMDFARIGRVPPPLAVTVAEDGTVSRWNLETGEVTAQAEAGDVAVFGAVNTAGSHLAWRNPDSTTLNLLEFESRENRLIAPLDSGYIAHLQLSQTADVIFGIDPLSQNGAVWVWITATGEQLDLGQYRVCQREQPDLARLSEDGTALVIGCDTGIDIWRV